LLLAWQIEVGEHWSFNPDLIAELEVHFISDGVDRTRVELEHRDLDRLGEQAAMVREVFDSPAGCARYARTSAEYGRVNEAFFL